MDRLARQWRKMERSKRRRELSVIREQMSGQAPILRTSGKNTCHRQRFARFFRCFCSLIGIPRLLWDRGRSYPAGKR